MLFSSIRRANQGTTLNIPESEVKPNFLVFFKLFRPDEFVHRKMLLARLQILTDCDDVYFGLLEVVKRFDNFFLCFSQAEHDSRLGSLLTRFLDVLQYLKTSIVFGLYPHLTSQSSNRFEIVRDYFWRHLYDTIYVSLNASEIGNQGLQGSFRIASPYRFYRFGPDDRTPVSQVITVNRSDHGMFD